MDADTEHRIDDRSAARATHAGADERRAEGSDDAEALAAGEAAFPAGGAALDTGVVDGLSAYCRVRPEELEPAALYAVLKDLLRLPDAPV